MHKKISIEHLPKLDKVLRITFSSIKKDLIESKEEFSQLDEKVENSLTLFRQRLNDFNDSIWKELKKKTDYMDNELTVKTTFLEKQLKELADYTEKFIETTNLKVTSWNKKIKSIDDNSARATEIGTELKKIKFLRADLEKIKILEKEINNLSEIHITKKDFKKANDDLDKKLNKKVDALKLNHDVFKNDFEKNSDTLRGEVSDKVSGMELEVKHFSKTLNSEVTNLKQEFDTKLKEKISLTNLEEDFGKRFTKLEKSFSSDKVVLEKSVEDLKKQFEKDNKKALAAAQESFIDTSKTEIKKALVDVTKNVNEGTVSVKDIKSDLNKISRAVDILKSRVSNIESNKDTKPIKDTNKKEKVLDKKEEKEKPKLKEKKPSFLKKIVDFLIEDIEEDKDKTLQEFDRKKGDKFEIKEIKELKE